MSPTSVIVVSHRPGSWLRRCLESTLPQADQIIVVDNGSPHEQASAEARRAGAICLRSERNLGFAGGINLGLTRATGDIVAWLNDDAEAGANWISAATTVLEADPTVAAVTPKVVLHVPFAEVILDDDVWFAPGDPRPLGRRLHSVTADGVEVIDAVVGAGVHDLEEGIEDGEDRRWRWTAGRAPFYVPLASHDAPGVVGVNGETVTVRTRCTLLNHAGNFLERHGIAGDYGFAAPDDGRFDAPAERFGLSGTAPVFRAEALVRVGALATPFFAYNEDTDWCLRARLAGYTIAYDPGATVVHRLSATSGGATNPRVRFLARRNALLCLARTAPAPMAWRSLWRRLSAGPDDGVRRSVIRALPWALASRVRMRGGWVLDPQAVWDRWAGADTTWDTAPARLEAVGDDGARGPKASGR